MRPMWPRKPVAIDRPREVALHVHRLAARAQAGLPLVGYPADAIAAEKGFPETGTSQRMVEVVMAVARECGAPVIDVTKRLAHTCDRLAEQHDRVVEAMAGPRMARRILVALPIASYPLTSLLGFDVAGVLFGTAIGWTLLGVSGALTLISMTWSKRMIRRAEAMPPAPGLYPRLMSVSISAGLGVNACEALTLRSLIRAEALDLLETDEARVTSVAIAEACRSGIPLGALLRSLDEQALGDAFHSSSIRIRELGEKLMLPLGVCTLPAFLAVGIVPALISVISSTALNSA